MNIDPTTEDEEEEATSSTDETIDLTDDEKKSGEGSGHSQEEAETDAALDEDTKETDEDDDVSPDSIALEKNARRLGWSAKSEWRGAEKDWIDASTFVSRLRNPGVLAERMVKIADRAEAEATRAVQAKIDALQAQIAHSDSTRSIADIKRDRDESIQALISQGDNEGAIAALRQFDEALETASSRAAPPPQQARIKSGADGERWIGDNPRFERDPVFRAEANRLSRQITLDYGQDLDWSTHFAMLDRKLAESDIIATPNGAGRRQELKPKKHPDQLDTGDGRGSRGKAEQARRLPVEARKIGRELVDAGAFKNLEAYAQSYFEEGDA